MAEDKEKKAEEANEQIEAQDNNTHNFNNLPILPLRQLIIYPGAIVPLSIGRPKTIKLAEEAVAEGQEIVIVTQKDASAEDPAPGGLYEVGCLSRIVKHVFGEQNEMSLVVQGIMRVAISRFTQEDPYYKADVKPLSDSGEDDQTIEALMLSLKQSACKLLEFLPDLPESAAGLIEHVNSPSVLADLIAGNIDGPVEEKQAILACLDLKTRLQKVLELVEQQLSILELSHKITSQVQGEMSKTQREFYLRQQLKAIKEELGDSDDADDDVADLDERFNSKELTEEAKKVITKELRRLHRMNPMQSEYVVARNYVEWLLDLPWVEESDDRLELSEVRSILDEDHYGLEKVKKRILEFLAVRKIKKDPKGPILCFVGPPGVGKTSLGRSIARAMGREFVRASMGGVRDEAEIRGHRRTYVGAMPGRIIQGMKRAGKLNPLFVLDEVDKLAHDVRGDPASALLEVLDPEQNGTFSDHYLNIPYDLSKVFFLTTANQLETIPPALRDRMEILELPGYTLDEKIHIARQHLLPKQLEAHGLSDKLLSVDDAVLADLITSYTKEAGVRNLEREIAALCRSVAVKVAGGDESLHTITSPMLADILGPERYFNEIADRTEIPGVATGMAWTPAGGDILFIEATSMKGKGELMLTGQLGDVMKESAQAALSYVRSQAAKLGIDDTNFKELDIHLHVPAGAVPKDGPSAGITIFTALVSLLTNTCVRADVAMTGEITLRGNVLPVGGIKEKVLAARRAGVKRIVLPERNRKDLVEVPEECKADLEFIHVSRIDEVLDAVLRR